MKYALALSAAVIFTTPAFAVNGIQEAAILVIAKETCKVRAVTDEMIGLAVMRGAREENIPLAEAAEQAGILSAELKFMVGDEIHSFCDEIKSGLGQ